MKTTEFTLPPKCRISTVTIKETFGSDEAEAVLASENNGTEAKDELINLSIVAVNGEPCLPGDSGFDRWPTKTRAVVKRFHNSVNDVRGADLIPFIEEAEESGTELVDGNVQTRYRLPEGSGLEFVVLKEMMEEDERAANASGRKASEVMIARCVVETNKGAGLTVEALEALNTRTRNILTTYWSGMNFVPEEELVPLIMAAEAVKAAKAAAETSDVASSPTGSGSAVPADAA